MKRYLLLYKLLRDHDKSLDYPVYHETKHGLPDIYASHHTSLVMYGIAKSHKYEGGQE